MLDNPIHQGTDEIFSWIDRYINRWLAFKRETTRCAYALTLRQFLTWLANLPGHKPPFDPPSQEEVWPNHCLLRARAIAHHRSLEVIFDMHRGRTNTVEDNQAHL